MMRRLMLAALVVMLIAGGVFAKGNSERGFLSRRGLSEQQIDRIEEVYRGYRDMSRELNAQMENNRAEIGRMVAGDSPDLAAIEVQLQEGADTLVELRLIQIRTELAVREIVGDDLWASIIGRRHRGFGRGRFGRGRSDNDHGRSRERSDDDSWLFYRNSFEEFEEYDDNRKRENSRLEVRPS